MAKHNYFESFDTLTECACLAVNAACAEASRLNKITFDELHKRSNEIICNLEVALFEDFIPPLERDGIAAFAHRLARIIDAAEEHMAICLSRPPMRKKSEEELICIQLAQKIKECVSILPTLRKKGELPDIQGFRSLAATAASAHNADIVKINSGALPKACIYPLLSVSNLRSRIVSSFDMLVELMLDNI
jgi:hypothetical protein